MPNTLEVGKKLVALCNEGKFDQAMADLYSPEEDTGPELLNGSLFAMPVLANGQRGMELVIPFHLRGY